VKRTPFLLIVLLFLTALAKASAADIPGGATEFFGTTPCGPLARTFLGIPRTNICDKITWQLTLSTNGYQVTATVGVQEQSAPGFVEGATTVKSLGKFEVGKGTRSDPAAPVFNLKDEKSGRTLTLAKITGDHLHILAEDKSLLVGNEFWSYTLNRKGPGRDH
jgi:hypothetical protein